MACSICRKRADSIPYSVCAAGRSATDAGFRSQDLFSERTLSTLLTTALAMASSGRGGDRWRDTDWRMAWCIAVLVSVWAWMYIAPAYHRMKINNNVFYIGLFFFF